MNSDVKVKRAPPWMNSSFIIKLMFHNQDGAIKSKSKELEKREMTALPYICSVVKTHSYSRVGKGVITVGLTAFFPLPPPRVPGQTLGHSSKARKNRRLISTSLYTIQSQSLLT